MFDENNISTPGLTSQISGHYQFFWEYTTFVFICFPITFSIVRLYVLDYWLIVSFWVHVNLITYLLTYLIHSFIHQKLQVLAHG